MSMNQERTKTVIKTLVIGLVLLLLIYSLTHCSSKNKPLEFPAPSVETQKPKLANMVEYIQQTGTMVAYNSVDLVARVEGFLDSIEFTDGSFVKKDKSLFVIQPEPYMEKLKAAQAQVAAEKAAYEYTQSEYERQKRMYKENATSLNNLEKWLAKTYEIKAEIDKALADEAIAAINYSYTHISAPFDGRIGRHLVDVGNLVGNGAATNLATIEQIAPLYVYFNLNELDLIKLRAAARAQGLTAADLGQIPAYISMQNSTTLHKVTLDFVNTGLNASTGTMEFRAILENKDLAFVPGLFVQVKIAVSKPTNQLTVPDAAVLYDQIGAYLLLVDSNSNVVLRRVKTGPVEQGMRAIVSGITAQDNVIVNGLQNATPGNKVDAHEQAVPSNQQKPK